MTDDEKIEAYLLGMMRFHAGFDNDDPIVLPCEVWDGYDDAARETEGRPSLYMPECLL